MACRLSWGVFAFTLTGCARGVAGGDAPPVADASTSDGARARESGRNDDGGTVDDARVKDADVDAGRAIDGGVNAGDASGSDAGSDAGHPVLDAGSDAGCAGRVLVNELRLESTASPLDQFVELYNPGTCPLDLGALRVAYREAHGTYDTTLWNGAPGATLASHAYFVLAGSDFIGTRDGALQADVLSRSGGGLGVYVGVALADSVGWGSATNAYVRASPAVSPGITQSLARSPNGVDTQDNFADFVATTAQTPGKAN